MSKPKETELSHWKILSGGFMLGMMFYAGLNDIRDDNMRQNQLDQDLKPTYTMEKIINQVREERLRQNQKWGEQNHSPIEWIAIIGEEFGEASKEAVDFHFENPVKGAVNTAEEGTNPDKQIQSQRLFDYHKELVQLAAVTIQAIESLHRNELK